MVQNKTDQTLKLKDGRTLGFAEYGDPKGKPIFEFHGNPSSRLGSELFDEAARKWEFVSSGSIGPQWVSPIASRIGIYWIGLKM
jgi:hypothetical protein